LQWIYRDKKKITCFKCLKPNFKSISKKLDSSSLVKIKVLIDKSGKVKKAELVESSKNKKIDAAALNAAKSSTFYPLDEDANLTIDYLVN